MLRYGSLLKKVNESRMDNKNTVGIAKRMLLDWLKKENEMHILTTKEKGLNQN